MARFILASLLLVSCAAFAGESGYMQNGETHVVYKDGKKVGEWPAKPNKAEARKPASFTDLTNERSSTTIYYQDDGLNRCYYTYGKNLSLSCAKKQESQPNIH